MPPPRAAISGTAGAYDGAGSPAFAADDVANASSSRGDGTAVDITASPTMRRLRQWVVSLDDGLSGSAGTTAAEEGGEEGARGDGGVTPVEVAGEEGTSERLECLLKLEVARTAEVVFPPSIQPRASLTTRVHARLPNR